MKQLTFGTANFTFGLVVDTTGRVDIAQQTFSDVHEFWIPTPLIVSSYPKTFENTKVINTFKPTKNIHKF